MQQKIICIQGLGFVGLAMATVVANVIDKSGNPHFKVYGVDLPSKQASIDLINKGKLPFKTEDKSFAPELHKAVCEYENLTATSDENIYQQADIVVVDVHLTISKPDENDYSKYHLHKESFEKAIHSLGEKIKAECLVLVETTVPPGFTKNVVYPILKEEFIKRKIFTEPLIAHSYERVMPGKEYLNSIRNYYRTFAGLNEESAIKAEQFLKEVIHTDDYPLRKEEAPEASELAKVMENSFRAMNIAFIYEWTLMAEKMGVNLFSVIEGIRNRNTHKNIMMPGLGVGGYCLTKDSLLALWSNDQYYHSTFGFPLSIAGLKINDAMPLHVVDLIEEYESLENKSVLILGVSYREDVGDTRFSPTEILYNALRQKKATVYVHDTYVTNWEELPDASFVDDFTGFDILVFATRHQQYLSFSAEDLLRISENTVLVVDANNILNDDKIQLLQRHQRRVIGIGKGHINKNIKKKE